jgi:DNA-binding CsgD family transcriptional regulator/tetratricopeptide (TPR) repeat protein
MLPLVGRADSVDVLDAVVDRVRQGRFAVVEVSGDPGIGKSTVLAEAARLAAAAGLVVYAGRATQFEREVPLAMFRDLFRQVRSGDGDRFRTFSAVRRHLECVTGGAALVLDDLQWADPASLELVEFLIRQPPEAPVLVVVAFRGARPPLRVVDAITRAGDQASRVHLDPLRAADVRQLLPTIAADRRGLLMRVSRGNPLYLKALTRLSDTSLAELARERDGDETASPDEFARRILRTLIVDFAALDEPVQRVAYAAAVVGDHAAIDLVAHVADLPESIVEGALDQLCYAGLGDMDGAWFGYLHPLIRAAAHELAGPAWRSRAHARAARYLREHHGPLHLLAHHVERSAQYGDDQAVATLVEAGRAVVFQAPGTAVRWLGTALRVLSTTGPLREQRPVVMLRYARALGLAGELPRSWEVLQELMAEGSPVRAEAAAFATVIARFRGELDIASALVSAEMPLARQDRDAEGRLRVHLAALAALREQAEDTVAHARRAIDLLDGQRPALASAALAMDAWGSAFMGDVTAARSAARDASSLLNTISDVTLSPHVELMGPLAWAEMRLGELTAAAEHLDRAHRVVEQAGHSSSLPYLLIVRAALETRLGHVDTALRRADQAALLADQMGSVEMRAMADAVRLRPLMWRDGPQAAVAAAETGLAGGTRPRSRVWWRVGQLSLAIANVTGETVRQGLNFLTDPDVDWPSDPGTEVSRQVTIAQALAKTDAIEDAWRAAKCAEAAAELDYERGLAWYASAYVALRAADPEHAVTLAEQAAEMFEAAGAPVEAAQAHHLTGLAQADDRAEATLARARTGYEECGADWLTSTVDADRLSLIASPPDTGPLTRREREIADLVATGLTNQEIATRLFVSRRTVESHLSHIFPKLNVRTRSALAHQLGKHT